MPSHDPTYEELYVVSDLHLGGTRGTPMFAQADRLAGLIRYVADRRAAPGSTIGLLLNGDVLDTLAEKISGYVCAAGEAERVVAGIMDHFPEVFAALEAFVGVEGHLLVVVGGNHDLELVYPEVQALIVQRLAGGDPLKRFRIRFEVNGTGYRCTVGSVQGRMADVLCVHGNEFDEWNAVEPHYLTRLVRASKLGITSPLHKTPPNAGTQLVIDVINGLKEQHPFVDLLKPEIETVFNVLAAVDPRSLEALTGFGRALFKAKAQKVRGVHRLLSEEPSREHAIEGLADIHHEGNLNWEPGSNLRALLDGNSAFGAEVLEEMLASVREGSTAEELELQHEVLGLSDGLANAMRYMTGLIRRRGRKEALRAALLDWIGKDRTWDLDGPDAVRDGLAKLDIRAHVVIAGHTHLRRQQRLRNGQTGPLYLNTGTWARLMQLRKADLEQEAFESLWGRLEARSMQSLDSLEPAVIKKQSTVAVVRANGDTVEAGLCEFKMGLDPSEALSTVPGAKWEVVVAS